MIDLKRVTLGVAFGVAFAILAVPAANADSARIGFGSFDITCEGDIWDVSDVMARRGITEFYLAEVGVTDFILTVEHDPATSALVDVIAELRRIGYGAYVIGAEGI